MEREKSYDDANQKVGAKYGKRELAMYNHHLATFLQVADNGSFMQAGEKMYVSANAVTKQINLLEQHLNIKLFDRSTQGLILTEAGKLIYEEAKAMMKRSDVVLQKARELEGSSESVIRVGVSLMNTSKILLEQWAKAAELYPNIKLQIIPFEDSADEFFDILNNLGKKIDVIPCTLRSFNGDGRCNTFHLRDLQFCVSVSKSHRLASHAIIDLSDLYDETLIMIKRGSAESSDQVREDLEQHHPRIHIQDVEYFEFSTFNQVAANSIVLLSAECWSDVHPLLVTIPVDWEYTIPYGLIYAKEPAKEVLQFIMAIGKVN